MRVKLLNQLEEVTGAKCLDYMDETECCGAPIIGVNEGIPLQLARDKLKHIKDVGAQAMVAVCPLPKRRLDLSKFTDTC